MFGLFRSAPQVLVVNGSHAAANVDTKQVWRWLKVREETGEAQTEALRRFRAAERAHDLAYGRAYRDADGPAHQLKHLAELATEQERKARDEAEVAWREAEDDVRMAELGWRTAMAGGASPDGGGS